MSVSMRRAAMVLAALLSMASTAAAQQAKPVVVFAAASLQTALNAAGAQWTGESGKQVTFSYAASSALARQLDSGAPADLFASADPEWMDWAETRRLIKPGSKRVLLGNTLVIVTQAETALDLTIAPGFALAEAIGDSRLATGNPSSVPAGKYAQAALTRLGVWDAVRPKVAGADNVRAALALVARGEAKLGIVYRTDAAAEPKVRVVGTFPAESHPPIVYPFAVTAASTNPDATQFLEFLSSPKAEAIFKAQGFSVLK